MDDQLCFIYDPVILDRIRKAMLSTYFSDSSNDFLESQWGIDDIDANVYGRYHKSLQHIVPWVSKQIDLQNSVVLEIGCGTGSSTAAFAHFVNKIIAYDIDKKSIDAAKLRMDILGLSNVEFHLVRPEDLLPSIKNDVHQADVVLLFAVLEHMTIHERHEIIRYSWTCLNDRGLLAVSETPNLLSYFDFHTSVLPFFHLLHSDLCAEYSVKSPRKGFNNDFSEKILSSFDKDLKMSRWGRGVSYHDFELTLGENYPNYIVSNGYEPEIMTWFGIDIEEEVLRFYIKKKQLDIPPAFTRSVINIIFKKRKDQSPDERVNENIPELSIFGVYASDLERAIRLKDVHIQNIEGENQALRHQMKTVTSGLSYRLGRCLTSPFRYLLNRP